MLKLRKNPYPYLINHMGCSKLESRCQIINSFTYQMWPFMNQTLLQMFEMYKNIGLMNCIFLQETENKEKTKLKQIISYVKRS